MSEAVIVAEELGKKYLIGHEVREPYIALRDVVSRGARNLLRKANDVVHGRQVIEGDKLEEVWALRQVSFQVNRGEVVGIIGHNGAGKSTLLKILSRITEPTTGRVTISGRIGSLLEVGTGFHPEMTGRENIFLNGAILGMSRAEVKRKFDDIVGFAETEKFLDTPVKRYSSGMYMRLAFAVAAHLEPEILVIDEVLAVGDAAFQKKCLGKMGDVARAGRTIIFVSHNLAAIQSLCTSAHLLSQGQLVATGKVGDVIGRYLTDAAGFAEAPLASRMDREGDGRLRFIEFRATNSSNGAPAVVCGSRVQFEIRYCGKRPLRNVRISLGIFNLYGDGVLYLSNDLAGHLFDEIPENGSLICRFDRFPLLPGSYSVNIYCTVNGILADWVRNAAQLSVNEGDFYGGGKLPPKGYGAVAVPQEWIVQ